MCVRASWLNKAPKWGQASHTLHSHCLAGTMSTNQNQLAISTPPHTLTHSIPIIPRSSEESFLTSLHFLPVIHPLLSSLGPCSPSGLRFLSSSQKCSLTILCTLKAAWCRAVKSPFILCDAFCYCRFTALAVTYRVIRAQPCRNAGKTWWWPSQKVHIMSGRSLTLKRA